MDKDYELIRVHTSSLVPGKPLFPPSLRHHYDVSVLDVYAIYAQTPEPWDFVEVFLPELDPDVPVYVGRCEARQFRRALRLRPGTSITRVDVPWPRAPVPNPAMTSASTQDGYRAFGVVLSGDTAPWFAFNKGPGWATFILPSSPTHFLGLEYPHPTCLHRYTVQVPSLLDRAIKAWDIEGSRDGVTYVTLDTRANQVWQEWEEKTYTLASPTAPYRFFRLVYKAVTNPAEGWCRRYRTLRGPQDLTLSPQDPPEVHGN